VKVRGVADRVAAAADSRNPREAFFHVESAELLQQRHAKSPFTALLEDCLATVAVRAGGEAEVLLPIDWLRRTAENDSALQEIDARVRKESKATKLAIVLTGTASAEASRDIAARGWLLVKPEAVAR
jgi:hypothetical protein